MSSLEKVEAGTIWQHKNGNKYSVVLLANERSERLEEYPVMVVYENIDNHTVWTRKLTDWHRSMTRSEIENNK